MKKIKEVLKGKAKDIWSIKPKATVFEALKLMDAKEIGALLVIEKGRRVEGIITERDYARKVILKGKASKKTLVEEIMTPFAEMYMVRPDATVQECMAVITEKKVRHLPVIENDRLSGIVSIGDLVKAELSEKEMLIEHLKNYISGSYFA
jgi:CBS domain-containing protein